MASFQDEFNNIHFQLRSFDELAQGAQHLSPALMQGLIAAGELTVFRADPNVDTSPFMYLLARSLATHSDIGPFATDGAVDVTLLVSSGHAQEDAAFINILQQYDRDWAAADTQKRLAVYHRHHEKDHATYLDTAEGRDALRESLLSRPRTKVVILDDIAKWLSPGRAQRDDEVRLEAVIHDLTQRGIALVVFDRATKAGERFCDQYLAHASNLIRLTRDDCAPVEIGGGFNICRKTLGLHDKLPATIQWWWAVIDGEFRTGWEWRDPASELSAKEIAIAEREILVRQYAADGWKQKDIAKALGIKQWTVSRDLAKPSKSVPPMRQGKRSVATELLDIGDGLH